MASTILARCTRDQGKEPLWAAACNASASRRAIVNLSGRRPRIRRTPSLSEPIVKDGWPSAYVIPQPAAGPGGGASGLVAVGGLTVGEELRVSPAVRAVRRPLDPLGPGEKSPGQQTHRPPRGAPGIG